MESDKKLLLAFCVVVFFCSFVFVLCELKPILTLKNNINRNEVYEDEQLSLKQSNHQQPNDKTIDHRYCHWNLGGFVYLAAAEMLLSYFLYLDGTDPPGDFFIIHFMINILVYICIFHKKLQERKVVMLVTILLICGGIILVTIAEFSIPYLAVANLSVHSATTISSIILVSNPLTCRFRFDRIVTAALVLFNYIIVTLMTFFSGFVVTSNYARRISIVCTLVVYWLCTIMWAFIIDFIYQIDGWQNVFVMIFHHLKLKKRTFMGYLEDIV